MRSGWGPLPLAVAAFCFTAMPGFAFDVIECDVDDTFGNAGILLGWPQPTAGSIASVVVHNGGFPGSMISGPTATAEMIAGIQQWNGITSSTLVVPTPTAAAISLAQVETNYLNANSERIVYPIGSTTAPPSFPGIVGWAGFFPNADITSTLALTGTQFNTSTRLIIDSDVYFNDDVAGSGFTHFGGGEGDTVNGFDIQSTMAHEWGHALGAEHSVDGSANMFFAAVRGALLTLQTDDMNFARFVYPTSTNPVLPDRNSLAFQNCTEIATTGEIIVKHSSSSPGCSLSPSRGTRPWGALLLMLFSTCLLAGRRRR